MNYRTFRKPGMSLTEVLVAITLVGVLAGILYPVYSKVRTAAHLSQCTSNIRQLGMAILEFAGNNNGRIMPRKLSAALQEQEPHVHAYWNRRLYNEGYIQGPVNNAPLNQIMFCPSLQPEGHPEVANQGYGMRAWRGTAVTLDSYLPINTIPNPSRFFILADSVTMQAGVQTQWYTIQLGDGQGNRVHLRHNHKANAFFADGHVEAMGEDYFHSLVEIEPEFTYRAILAVNELPDSE